MDTNWKKEDLSFADSWKEKHVELAATTAIIVGAGAFAARGNAPNVIKYGKKTLGQVEKGFDRYVTKKLNPSMRFGYQTTKKLIRNIQGLPKLDPKKNYEEMVEEGRVLREAIKDEDVSVLTKKRLNDQFRNHDFNAKRQSELDPNFVAKPYQEPSVIEVEETIRQELLEQAHAKKVRDFAPKHKKPFMTKEEMAQNGVASLIAGAGFAGGLTLFHHLHDKQHGDTKEIKRSFEAAGSHYKKDKKEGYQMKKQAGIREIHDGLASLGKKVPAAAATGLGFTGVSLATASHLNKKKEEEKAKSNPNGDASRIIIEFGADDVGGRAPGEHLQAGGLGMIPRPDFNKQSSVNRFLKNLGGRESELNALERNVKHTDYNQQAADSLKGKDVDALANGQYGHVFKEPERVKEKFLDSTAHKLKQQDINKQEDIRNEVARDRMYGLGGLGVAGLGAGAIHHSRKDEKNG